MLTKSYVKMAISFTTVLNIAVGSHVSSLARETVVLRNNIFKTEKRRTTICCLKKYFNVTLW